MLRVLVVDDETAARDLLEAMLAKAGYKVEQADGGAAALARAFESEALLTVLERRGQITRTEVLGQIGRLREEAAQAR